MSVLTQSETLTWTGAGVRRWPAPLPVQPEPGAHPPCC